MQLLYLLLLPLLALAQAPSGNQSNTNSAANTNTNSGTRTGTATAASGTATSAAAATSFSLVTFTQVLSSVSLGPNRQPITVVQTTTFVRSQPIVISTTSTPAKPLPTFTAKVDGGGQQGAPVPGAKSNDGKYGPNDDYIAAASTLARNSLLTTLVAGAIGAALLV